MTEAEIEQARLLNEKSSSLLEASAESSEQAKKSIYMATFAIIISALLSLWAIIETRAGNESTGVSLDKLISETQLNGSSISFNTAELKQLIDNVEKEKQGPILDVKKLEAQQSDYLLTIVKILTQMDDKLGSDKLAGHRSGSPIDNPSYSSKAKFIERNRP